MIGAALSPRQSEVLSLLAQGYRAKEIAKLLDVKPRTIYGYIEFIRLKLDADNTPEAVQKASQLGLIASQEVQP